MPLSNTHKKISNYALMLMLPALLLTACAAPPAPTLPPPALLIPAPPPSMIEAPTSQSYSQIAQMRIEAWLKLLTSTPQMPD